MKHNVRLSVFRQSDLPKLRNWLAQPHVARWYPSADANLEWASWPPEGGSQAIIEVDGRSVGYIRWQLVSRAILDSIGLVEIPSNSADVDLLIGDNAYTSSGVGPAALSLLASRLMEQGGVPLMGLTTSRENTIAHKAFEKAGFMKTAEYSPEGFGECFLFSRSLGT